MADADTIATIKSQVLANIAEITLHPKPSYTVDGQSVSWTEYLQQLQEIVNWCDVQLAGEEPFEIQSIGYT